MKIGVNFILLSCYFLEQWHLPQVHSHLHGSQVHFSQHFSSRPQQPLHFVQQSHPLARHLQSSQHLVVSVQHLHFSDSTSMSDIGYYF